MVIKMLITFVRRYDRVFMLLGLAAIAITVGLDMVLDIKDGLPWQHLVHEALILGFCLILTLYQVRVIAQQRLKLASKTQKIAELTQSREEFRRKSTRFTQEFSAAVNEQFREWHLTESERDVAILLIKGASMKEIADDRASKETTVRQQAAAIYKKASVEGRQELTAFFLEDLFSPLDPKK
jgi:DNA-binding NarL/FixJ family response regulator